jgi:hypothetical protein
VAGNSGKTRAKIGPRPAPNTIQTGHQNHRRDVPKYRPILPLSPRFARPRYSLRMPPESFARSLHLHRSLAGAGLIALVVIGYMGVRAGALDRAGDFHCFYEAARSARLGQDIYASGYGGYIYPPLLAWALQPLSLLDRASATVVWNLLTLALMPTAAGLAAFEVARRLRVSAIATASWGAAGFGVLVVIDKLRRELVEGNSDLVVILTSVLALRWLPRHPWLAGLALGLAINIKYLPVVFLPYLIVRGRFQALAGTIVGVVLFAFLPAVSFGWNTNLEYLQVAFRGLMTLGGADAGHAVAANIHPLAWDDSVSIPSALARTGLPGAASIGTALAAGVALAIAWAIYRARGVPMLIGRWGPAEDSPERAGVVAVEWAMLLAGALAFSPQTTPRHMNMALLLCVLAGTLFIHARSPGRWVALAGSAVFLAALIFPPRWNEPLLRLLVAWRKTGGMSLGLLAMLFCVQWVGLGEAVKDRSAPG